MEEENETTLGRVLKPLGTRNKNSITQSRCKKKLVSHNNNNNKISITQSMERIVFKNYYILHKLHDRIIHLKSVFQSLLLTDWY